MELLSIFNVLTVGEAV